MRKFIQLNKEPNQQLEKSSEKKKELPSMVEIRIGFFHLNIRSLPNGSPPIYVLLIILAFAFLTIGALVIFTKYPSLIKHFL